ncbi:ABC transporter ATP-binding protein [Allopusillimonas soli]|uniref:ABC transporter ATP-binding protein n=1 Tax=Allopusillimonas soli TaxID=659016 RepID=A0A853FFD6_9BURK|nr:ABC transporter ATP-binding protein [Allopusillimonas soli]NYT36736.1 ABC transporter ATP-binding protein [Allopusillimonas soli]TEA75210.1 ABC transporter ATP-binding protein [Allopusillimonas soli]
MDDQRPHASSPIVLDVTGLTVAYGKAEVVHGANLRVHEGEFVVLLGRNGAGKSSSLHAIGALIQRKGGEIRFLGQDVTKSNARALARMGLVNVLEGHRVFTTLSVEDNLMLGTYAQNPHGDKAAVESAMEIFPELADLRHQLASRLSGGQQQILAVAQGIAAKPKLLVLDEPSGGLAPLVIDRILTVAKTLTRQGTAVLLVEQLVKEAFKFADYCYLMENGKIGGEGTVESVRSGDLIQRIYLGGAASEQE